MTMTMIYQKDYHDLIRRRRRRFGYRSSPIVATFVVALMLHPTTIVQN
jgi:hypothetical protein